MGVFAILSTHIILVVGVCVRVCLCKVRTFVLTTPLASVSLQRHWVVPFVAPAPTSFTHSFCLSVSYLIELAQKQSKDRYLRLRAKGYWCLVEVSALSLCLCVSLYQDPFKRIYEQQIKGNHNDVSLFCWDSMVVDTPPSLYAWTHLAAFKQVSWLISDTYPECQRELEQNLGALQN